MSCRWREYGCFGILHHKNDEITTYTLTLSLILSFFTVAKVLTIFFRGTVSQLLFQRYDSRIMLVLVQQIDTKPSCVCVCFLILNFQNKKLGRTHASRSCYGWDRQLWLECLCWKRFPVFFFGCVFAFWHGSKSRQHVLKTFHVDQSASNQDEISFILPGAKRVWINSRSLLCGVFWKGMTTPVDERLGKKTSILFPYHWTWRHIPCWSIVRAIIGELSYKQWTNRTFLSRIP